MSALLAALAVICDVATVANAQAPTEPAAAPPPATVRAAAAAAPASAPPSAPDPARAATPGATTAVPSSTSPATSASPPPAPTETSFFPWLARPGGFETNWKTGAGHFLLGIVGALITVYLFLGEFLPSMGGKTQYDLSRQELDDQKKRRDAALIDREKLGQALSGRDNLPASETSTIEVRLRASDGLLRGFDRHIRRLEQEVARERWRLFLLGFPMYMLLGGFFAAAFALNNLQAVLIGFGWTAVADRIGLQKELAVKRQITSEQISRVETAGLEELKKLRDANQKLESQLQVAKSVADRATAVLAPKPPPASS